MKKECPTNCEFGWIDDYHPHNGEKWRACSVCNKDHKKPLIVVNGHNKPDAKRQIFWKLKLKGTKYYWSGEDWVEYGGIEFSDDARETFPFKLNDNVVWEYFEGDYE